MFQIVSRSNCFLQSAKVKLKQVQLFISVGLSTQQHEEINKVEIVGTVHSHLYTLPSGYKSYMVRTDEPGNKFYYHMVGTGSKNTCNKGQRIHLIGRLTSFNYWTEDGKLRQKIIIKCGELELLPQNTQTQKDLNRVKLCAQISSDIENTRDTSSFTITTRHTPKGGVRAGIFITEYHRILVREPSLLEIVRHEVRKNDWICIDGRIGYTFTKNKQEKLRQSAYILANTLIKQGETISRPGKNYI